MFDFESITIEMTVSTNPAIPSNSDKEYTTVTITADSENTDSVVVYDAKNDATYTLNAGDSITINGISLIDLWINANSGEQKVIIEGGS